MEYVVLAAVLVLGLVAGLSIFGGRVGRSLDTEGQAVGEVAGGRIGPIRDRYGEPAGAVQSGEQGVAAAPGLGTSQGALSAGEPPPESEPEGDVLAGPRGADPGAASGASGASASGQASAAVKLGLGDEIDKAVSRSPRLAAGLKALTDKGWRFEWGEAGKGSWCSKDAKKIHLAGEKKKDLAAAMTTLAHEMGHAQYKPDPYVPMDGLTREQFVDRNVMRMLKDEGETVLTNIEVKREFGNDDPRTGSPLNRCPGVS